ncbi:Phospholysine phosphohistidine inorganic pyrophosphate phosphatase [Trichoplax sp. H2]|uniref:Phospholysine phosphohistidine inorganic pyrophosphate phosphatase n=1 Tax=Trichoplax adhaerens TaxID=10228 RepID=B3SB13_TRIAD|nr:hypothetical protein TRIADDRAFT_32553 [Trichoplax adhaerens]EDV20029.1 hypothetical protein TRIADDRAFT_32553 [Trichoplax adhaerens]RDD45602.1 Phospholysine phosphohistidine inorganic pyrophosphate phosphatase [Trichoplax sp. H2]|eukprot:XP_002117413.1 hypothetical protein TRIADDRAFT_32553 [Trichoplax adhaerens]
MASSSWLQRGNNRLQGLLLDISGVLYNSGVSGGQAIDGSVEALARLKKAHFPLRLCTNESQCSIDTLVKKLQRLGFNVQEEDIYSPIKAVKSFLIENSLRPHLLVHPDVLDEFVDIDQSNPNCVVIGDATDAFSYAALNEAFTILMNMKQPKLISLGKGRYYQETDGLKLDVGPFSKVLEYACQIEAEVVGKPSKTFFMAALAGFNINPEHFLMIGDDVVSDVGGAQACGLRGVLVRTGKYRPSDENHPQVQPDAVVNNLAQAVDSILQ